MDKLIQLIITHDDVFKAVKQETSLYAEGRIDSVGNSMFEQIVFDEEYEVKFREYFFDAQSEIIPALLAYIKDTPEEPEYFEPQNTAKNRDFIVSLFMPNGFLSQLNRTLALKLRYFFMNYIVGRWLEIRYKEDSAFYKEKAALAYNEIKALLEKRRHSYRRMGGYF